MSTTLSFILYGISGLIIVIGIVCYGWFQLSNTTNKLLREQNAGLKGSIADLKAEISISTQSISVLNGKVEVLSSIPLQAIALALRDIATTNQAMLQMLRSSANTLAIDTSQAKVATAKVATDLAETQRTATLEAAAVAADCAAKGE